MTQFLTNSFAFRMPLLLLLMTLAAGPTVVCSGLSFVFGTFICKDTTLIFLCILYICIRSSRTLRSSRLVIPRLDTFLYNTYFSAAVPSSSLFFVPSRVSLCLSFQDNSMLVQRIPNMAEHTSCRGF